MIGRLIPRYTNLKPGSRRAELGVVLDDLLVDRSAVCFTQSLLERILEGDIATIIFDIVDQFNGKGQSNNVHVQALDLFCNGCNALILETLGDHDLASSGPVDSNIGEVLTSIVVDPSTLSYERYIGKGRNNGGQCHSTQKSEDVHLLQRMPCGAVLFRACVCHFI